MRLKLMETPTGLERITRYRYRETLNFIGHRKFGSGLDVGGPNPFTSRLAELCLAGCGNTEGDLDRRRLTGAYDVVFCFEVIEHVMNPLFLLDSISEVLEPGGVLFLTTPRRPHFLRTDNHFHEFDAKRLEALLEKGGWHVVRKKLVRAHYGFGFHLRGFRPVLRWLLRLLFARCVLLELKKI